MPKWEYLILKTGGLTDSSIRTTTDYAMEISNLLKAAFPNCKLKTRDDRMVEVWKVHYEDTLAFLSDQGWELVAASESKAPGSGISIKLYFKRPKRSEPLSRPVQYMDRFDDDLREVQATLILYHDSLQLEVHGATVPRVVAVPLNRVAAVSLSKPSIQEADEITLRVIVGEKEGWDCSLPRQEAEMFRDRILEAIC